MFNDISFFMLGKDIGIVVVKIGFDSIALGKAITKSSKISPQQIV